MSTEQNSGAEVLGALVIVILVALLVFWGVQVAYNHLVPVLLPGLVSSGTIAGTISYWNAAVLTGLCHVLFKASSSSK
jgi:hypothetical protein